MLAAASPGLLQLARRQRMSTPVQRMVFVAIMGAESSVDAFERVIRLNLKVPLLLSLAPCRPVLLLFASCLSPSACLHHTGKRGTPDHSCPCRLCGPGGDIQ